MDKIVDMNDEGKEFPEIADYVEKKYLTKKKVK